MIYKTFGKLLVVLLLFFSGWNTSNSQVWTLAEVYICNPVMRSLDSIQFDMKLVNISDVWTKWANGTFQFSVDKNFYEIDPSQIQLSFLGESDLNLTASAGGELPLDGYKIQTDVVGAYNGSNGRFSVMVLGPVLYNNSIHITKGDTILLGRFVMYTTDRRTFPPAFYDNIVWLKPLLYYQACAYKIYERDSLLTPLQPDIKWAYINNNIEMDDGVHFTVVYEKIVGPEPCFEITDFDAKYVGDKKIQVTWNTNCEAYNQGFILKRGIKDYYATDCTTIPATDTIVARSDEPPIVDELIPKGGFYPGEKVASYTFIDTTIQYRNVEYCYSLYYKQRTQTGGDTVKFHGCRCVPIPNALIVFAQANPNPFSSSTRIDYEVEDDVYLTVRVIDINGKFIKYLSDDSQNAGGGPLNSKRVPKGKHHTIFSASELSSQGLYDVFFLAYPVDDPSVELSRAVVKVQLLK